MGQKTNKLKIIKTFFFQCYEPNTTLRIIKIDLKTNIRIKKETDEKIKNFLEAQFNMIVF
jgi:hypothetical protein